MKNEMPVVRRKAMELLNNKMQHSKDKIEDEEVPLFLGLVNQLLNVVKAAEDEVAVNKQTALFSLKVLCRVFGTAHPQTFKPVNILCHAFNMFKVNIIHQMVMVIAFV
jgi:U3 small nucleolar RNA-associated protein 10